MLKINGLSIIPVNLVRLKDFNSAKVQIWWADEKN